MARTKKIISLVLACMFLIAFTACSNSDGSQTTTTTTTRAATTTTTKATTQTTTEEVSDIPDYVNPGGVFPIATQELELRFAVPVHPNIQDYTTNDYTLWLEEQSGCKFVFDLLPYEELETRVMLSLASFSNLPDAYFGLAKTGSRLFSVTNIARYGTNGEGQLIPLNDMIEKYGIEYKKHFAAPELLEQGINLRQQITSADGNIYMLPVLITGKTSRSSNILWINQNWLAELNLEKPTTTEELYNVLKAFKEQDPNRNDKDDTYPMFTADNDKRYYYSATNYLMGSFIDINPKFNYLITDGVGSAKLIFAPIKDEWREGLKYINRLTTEGLLDPTSFTNTEEQVKQIIADPNDIVGSFVAIGLNHMTVTEGIMERYTYLSPVKGPGGVAYACDNVPLTDGSGAITVHSKYPEVVFRITDLMISYPEGVRRSRYGVEGIGWRDPLPGELDRYGRPATITLLENYWGKPQNVIWWGVNPRMKYIDNDGMHLATLPYHEMENGRAALAYDDYYAGTTVPSITYPLELVQEISELSVTLTNYVKESVSKFAVGEWDPNNDTHWNRYLNEYKAIGLEKFMQYSQTAYDKMVQ